MLDDTGIILLKFFIRLSITFLTTDLSTFGDVLLLARIDSELDVLSFHLCTGTKYGDKDGEKGMKPPIRVKNAQLFFLKNMAKLWPKMGYKRKKILHFYSF